MAIPVYVAPLVHFSDADWKRMERIFRDFLWQFADKKCWRFLSWERVWTPKDQGGWGIPNVISKAHKLLNKWILKLDSGQPWALIARKKIQYSKLLGSTWDNTNWTDKVMFPTSKLKMRNAPTLQNLVNSWKECINDAPWKAGMRFDSSLRQSIWLCKVATKNNIPAVHIKPALAKALEKKRYRTAAKAREWSIDQCFITLR